MKDIRNENVIGLLNSEIVGYVTGFLDKGIWRLFVRQRRILLPTINVLTEIGELPPTVSTKEVDLHILISIEWHEMKNHYEQVVQYIKAVIEDEFTAQSLSS